jgi:hypothetical protein
VTSYSPFGYLFEVAVPGFAPIEAELLDRPAGQQVPGAFDIPGGKRFALTPGGNGKVSSVPSSFHDQPVIARSGTIDTRLFCGTCWSYMTRLLKTPIIDRLTAPVASSSIDIEAGLSKCDMIRTPPNFCASAMGGGDRQFRFLLTGFSGLGNISRPGVFDK